MGPDGYWRGQPNSEEYTVRRKWVERVMHEFALTPDRYCFATRSDARLPRYYTQEQDALSLRWDEADTMWCNPTWSDWWLVVTGKVKGEWPRGVKIYCGKMYCDELLCAPEGLMFRVVQILHRLARHAGVDRLHCRVPETFCLAACEGTEAPW